MDNNNITYRVVTNQGKEEEYSESEYLKNNVAGYLEKYLPGQYTVYKLEKVNNAVPQAILDDGDYLMSVPNLDGTMSSEVYKGKELKDRNLIDDYFDKNFLGKYTMQRVRSYDNADIAYRGDALEAKAYMDRNAIDDFDVKNNAFMEEYKQKKAAYDLAAGSAGSWKDPNFLKTADYVVTSKEEYDKLKKERRRLQREYEDNPLVKGAYQSLAQSAQASADLNLEKENSSSGQDYNNYKHARKFDLDAAQLYALPVFTGDDSIDKDFWKGMGAGVADVFEDRDFWTLGITELARNVGVSKIFEGLKEKGLDISEMSEQDFDYYLTDSQKSLLFSFMRYGEAAAQRSGNMPKGYSAGQTSAGTLGYMWQFLITGGVGSAIAKGVGKAATKAVAKGTANGLTKFLSRAYGKGVKGAIEQSVKRGMVSTLTADGNYLTSAMKPVINAAAKTAGSVYEYGVKPIARSVARTPFMMSTYVAASEDLLERAQSTEELGSIGSAFLESVWNALPDQLIENWSEDMGPAIGAFGGAAKKGIMKAAGATVGKINVGKLSLGQWGKWVADSYANKVLLQAGFNGLVGEMAEEWIGNAARVAVGLMDKEEFDEFASPKQQIEMAISFAPMSLLGLGSSSVAAAKQSKEYKSSVAEMRGVLNRAGMTQEEISDILDTKHSKQEIADALTPVLSKILSNASTENGQTTSVDDYKATLRFAQNIAANEVMSAAEDVYKQELRMRVREQLSEELGAISMDDPRGKFSYDIPMEGGNSLEAVTTVEDENGHTYYYMGEKSSQVLLKPSNGGDVLFVDKKTYDDKASSGEYKVNTQSVDSFLDAYASVEQEKAETAARDKHLNDSRKQIIDTYKRSPGINLGTNETPKVGTVTGFLPDGLVVEFENPVEINGVTKKIHKVSYEQAGNAIGVDSTYRSEAEVAQDEADSIMRKQKEVSVYNGQFKGMEFTNDGKLYKFVRMVDAPYQDENGVDVVKVAAQDGTEVVEVTMPLADLKDRLDKQKTAQLQAEQTKAGVDASKEDDGTPKDFRGNPLPMKTNDSGEQEVDTNALWNKDPEAFLRWNDERRGGTTEDSQELLSANIAKLQAQRQALVDKKSVETVPSEREAIDGKILTLDNTINLYSAILQKYQAESNYKQKTQEYAAAFADLQRRMLNAKKQEQYDELKRAEAELMRKYLDETADSAQNIQLAKACADLQLELNKFADMPVSMVTYANVESVMRENGASNEAIQSVLQKMAVVNRENLLNGHSYVLKGCHNNGMVYIFAEGNANIENARTTYYHERQHELNARGDSAALNEVMDLAKGDAEALYKTLEAIVGESVASNYKGSSAKVLADEIVAYTIQEAYSDENYTKALEDLGLSNELITIITKEYGRQTGKENSVSERPEDGYRDERRSGRKSASQNERADEEEPSNEQLGGVRQGDTSEHGEEVVGRSLTSDEADALLAQMENSAEVAPEIELTPDNWLSQFGEDGLVDTPIGKVKMGENQYFKIILKKREKEFGMIYPTLSNPDIVIEEPSTSDTAERNTSLLFVKTFIVNGEKVKYYASVTVSKDSKEVVISNHFIEKAAFKKKLLADSILYLKPSLSNSSDRHLAEHQDDVPDLLPTQDSNGSNTVFSLHPITQIEESVPLNDSSKLTNSDTQPASLGINSSNTSSEGTKSEPKKQDNKELSSFASEILNDTLAQLPEELKGRVTVNESSTGDESYENFIQSYNIDGKPSGITRIELFDAKNNESPTSFVIDGSDVDASREEQDRWESLADEYMKEHPEVNLIKYDEVGIGFKSFMDAYNFLKWAEQRKEIPIQGLENYSRGQIKEMVREHVARVLANAGFDVEVLEIEIHGSRARGDAKNESDLDVVVEYKGAEKEDGLFNVLNNEDDALFIDGIKVDINPIRAEESGTMSDYMKRSEAYDKEKLNASTAQSTYQKKEWSSDSDVNEMKARVKYLERALEIGTEESKKVFPEYDAYKAERNELKKRAPEMQPDDVQKALAAIENKYKEYNERIRAIYDELSNLNDSIALSEQKEIEKEISENKAQQAEAKRTKYNGFLEKKTTLAASSADKVLSKKSIFDSDEMTLAEFVESHFADGSLKYEKKKEQSYPPRARWNRMDQKEQSEWMEKHKPETVYVVNGFVVNKTAYDYAEFLSKTKSDSQKQSKEDFVEYTKARAKEMGFDERIDQVVSPEEDYAGEIHGYGKNSEIQAVRTKDGLVFYRVFIEGRDDGHFAKEEQLEEAGYYLNPFYRTSDMPKNLEFDTYDEAESFNKEVASGKFERKKAAKNVNETETEVKASADSENAKKPTAEKTTGSEDKVATKESNAPKAKRPDPFQFVWSDKKDTNHRPLEGVYHGNGMIVATDARVLLAIKSDYPAELEGKITDKQGQVIEHKYPNWEILFDRKKVLPVDVNLEKLALFLEQIKSQVPTERQAKADTWKSRTVFIDFGNGTIVGFEYYRLVKFVNAARFLNAKLSLTNNMLFGEAEDGKLILANRPDTRKAATFDAQKGEGKLLVDKKGDPLDNEEITSEPAQETPVPEQSPETRQEPKERIEDVGEKIAGARKDMLREYAASMENVNVESLISLPFSKVFKRPNLNKAVENGALRARDARFAESVMSAFLSNAKPRFNPSSTPYKRNRQEKNIKAWAEKAYVGIQLLSELFNANEAERDAIIERVLSEKAYNEQEIEERKAELKSWNNGREFNGQCYPVNPVAVFMKVYEQLDYNTYGEQKCPIAEIEPDRHFEYYILSDANGKSKYYPTRKLNSVDAVIDEIVYATKLENADSDTDHPMSTLFFKGEGRTIVNGKVEYEKYNAFFSAYGKQVEIGQSFSSKEEGVSWVEEHHDEYNDIVNKQLAEEKAAKNGRSQSQDVWVERYWDIGAKKSQYAIVISDKYVPKSRDVFNTMPYSIADGFETKEAAEKYLESHKAEIDSIIADIAQTRRSFTYFDGDAKSRVGEDYRKGKDVSAEEFRSTFGFRGVQFGEWANQADRQAALNNAYDSFLDLAKFLGISPLSISLNGELGMAFGSRGRGGKAAAHYELEEVVINLTKPSGAGSLAHEWWHALDNYFARQSNVPLGMVTETKTIPMRDEMRKAYNQLIDNVEKSKFNKRSRQRGAGYWGSMVEETARLFETWVFDELHKRGENNHFLTSQDPSYEETFARNSYRSYINMLNLKNEHRAEDSKEKVLSFEEFKETPMALMGYVYPTQKELTEFDHDLRNIFGTVRERTDEGTGKVALFSIGKKESIPSDALSNNTEAKQLAFDAAMTMLDNAGVPVESLSDEAMRQMAEMANALETASVLNEHQPTVVSSASGTKVIKDIDKLTKELQNVSNYPKTILGDIAKALGAEKHGSNSQYVSFEAKNGKVVTIRLASHNAKTSTFDNHGEDTGISIVISARENDGVNNDGKAHVTEFYYDAIKLRKAEGKPLVEIVKSIKQTLFSGEYKDTTGLAQIEEVNADAIPEFMTVYHGSGAKFDSFDHSHMGEGEGNQAYGWGTYVTEVEGIGRTYAETSFGKGNDLIRRCVVCIKKDMSNGLSFEEVKNNLIERLGGIFEKTTDESVYSNFRRTFEWLKTLSESNFPKRVLYTVDIPDDISSQPTVDELCLAIGTLGKSLFSGYGLNEVQIRALYNTTFQWYEHNRAATSDFFPAREAFKTYGIDAEAIDKSIRDKAMARRRENSEEFGNYLNWEGMVSAKQYPMWIKAMQFLGVEGNFASVEEFKSRNDDETGISVEFEIEALGRQKGAREVSKALSEAGFTGISYPAEYMTGGRSDGARNYVIFDENDLKITNRIEFLRDGDIVYGAVVGGRILLNKEHLNPNTPIHEYTHLWDKACQENNPELWLRGVELMRTTPLWDELRDDPNYSALDDRALASEVHARLSGENGAAILEKMSQKVLDDKQSPVMAKAKKLAVIEELKDWLGDFWSWLKDTMTGWTREEASEVSLEDFIKMPISDLAKGVNLSNTQNATKEISLFDDTDLQDIDGPVRFSVAEDEANSIVGKAKADGTFMKAPNGKPSNLNERQWAQVRTTSFKNWFGDWEKEPSSSSKVIDENGEPLVVYHGGPYRFYEFDKSKMGRTTQAESAKRGFFFTDSRSLADLFAEGAADGSINEAELIDYIKRELSIKPDEDIKRFFDAYKESDLAYEEFLEENDGFSDYDFLRGYVYEYIPTDVEKSSERELMVNYILDSIEKEIWSGWFDSGSAISKKLSSMDIEWGHTEPVFLNLRNPIVDDIKRDYYNEGESINPMAPVMDSARRLKRDGVIFTGIYEEGRYQKEIQYVVFEPNQIKTAVDNNGEFSADNDDIRYSIGVTQKMDAVFQDAFEQNNVELARELLDRAAKNAGYKYKGFHGSNAVFNTFDPAKLGSRNWLAPSASMGFFASSSRKTAEAYTGLNSMDSASLFLNNDAQDNMARIKEQFHYADAEALEEQNREEFERQYRAEHGYKENVEDNAERMMEIMMPLYEKHNLTNKQLDEIKEGIFRNFDIEWNKTVPDGETDNNLNLMIRAYEETQEHKSFVKFQKEVYDAWEKTELKRLGYTPNIKELYIKIENPLIHDFKGEGRDVESFAARMDKAKKEGRDGCIFKNVEDGADTDTIYAVFDNTQFKSAEPFTFDDDGKLIPLSERFSEDNADVRFSIGDFREGLDKQDDIYDAFVDVLSSNGDAATLMEALEEYYNGSVRSASSGAKRAMENGLLPFPGKQYAGKDFEYHHIMFESNDGDTFVDAVPFDTQEKVEKLIINRRFNNKLQEQIDGTLRNGFIYELGYPSSTLINTGVPSLPIELSSSHLADKAKQRNHQFDLSDIKDLPIALQNPIAVFAYGDKDKAQNIIVAIERDEKKFVVGIHFNQERKGLIVNDIRGIFNKDNAEWLNWINQGKALYLNKEEIQALIDKQRTNLAEVEYLDLDSIAKLVKDFENPISAEEAELEESGVRYSIVDDPATLRRLDAEPKMKVYRAMQLVDGKLYPPMSGKVNGEWREGLSVDDLGKVWEQADENPELVDEKGRFTLNKGNGKSLKARYNPYIHTSVTPLNDQFSSAQDRPELVTVEVEVPVSELYSQYKAEKAKDKVGAVEWKAGVVQAKLSGKRTVILSRWDRPMRIVPNSEVADEIVKMFNGKKITMPSNVVTPELRAELEKRGVPFVETDNKGNRIKDSVEFSIGEGLSEVNEKFNEDLSRLTEANADSITLSLGKPSQILVAAGVIDKPMKLYGNKVIKKMKKHGFELEELRDLPRAVAEPIAVFNNYGEDGNRAILTELKTADRHILVSLVVGKDGVDADFNIVSSVFGKGQDNIVDWITKGYLTYINKEKALQYLHFSESSIPEASNPERLSTAAKVVKEFVNPTLRPEDSVEFSIESLDNKNELLFGQLERAKEFGVLMGIYDALPDDVRGEIIKRAPSFGYNFASATADYFAKLSTKEGSFSKEEWELIRDVRDLMKSHLGIRELSLYDTLWALCRMAYKDQLDILSSAYKALAAHKLGFSTSELAQEKATTDAVNFSISEDMKSSSAAEMYARATSYFKNRLKEGAVDMFTSINDLVEAIELATGENAEAFEDIRLALNQQSSKGLAEMENYTRAYLQPMFDTIGRIVNNTGLSYDDLSRYVVLKHAVERNVVFAKRDAKAFYKNILNSTVNTLEKDNADLNKKRKAAVMDGDRETLAAIDKQIDDNNVLIAKAKADYEAALKRIESGNDIKYNEFREQDYGGLTSMYSEYPGLQPRSAYKTDEAYNQAARKVRKPMFDNVADMEEAAIKEVADIENKITMPVADELWDRINAATKATLDGQYQSNMLSKEQYEAVRGQFKYYVPLRGFKDITAEDIWSYYNSSRSDSFAPAIISAKGRTTEAENPFNWIGTMASSSIAAGVKNRTKLALYYFIANRPNQDLVSLGETWYRYDPQATSDYQSTHPGSTKRIFSAVYPPVTEGLDSKAAKDAYAAWENDLKAAKEKGEAYQKKGKLNVNDDVAFIDAKQTPEHIIRCRVLGSEVDMIINSNPRAAQAVNGLLNLETDKDYKVVFGKILRYLSAINTSLNPEFWISNMQRDLLFGVMSSFINGNDVKSFGKNILSPRRLMKLMSSYRNGTLGNSKLESYYREFAENGAITGYTVINSNDYWEQKIQATIDPKFPDKVKAPKFLAAWQNLGEATEQMTRFAAYVTARENGQDVVTAVNAAKEITVNFNRKGSGKAISRSELRQLLKKNGEHLNEKEIALWHVVSFIPAYGRRMIMFFNAGVQALNAMYKLYAKDSRRFASCMLGYFLLGVAGALAHGLLGGDDDDNDYLDMPDYTRQNNLLLGCNGIYFKWALPQEARVFYAFGDMFVNHLMGRSPHKNLLKEMSGAINDMLPLPLLPFGVEFRDFVRDFVPSVVQPIADIVSNKDFTGSRVYNDLKYLSDEERKRTPRYQYALSGTGSGFVDASKFLNILSGGNEYDAGWVNVPPEVMQHIVETLGGGLLTTVNRGIRTLSGTVDAVTGKDVFNQDLSVRNAPFLNRVLIVNDERTRNAYVTGLFNYYKSEALHAKSVANRIGKKEGLSAKRKYMHSSDYEVYKVYDKYQSELKRYDSQIREETDAEERKSLMRRQDEVRRRMVKEMTTKNR